MAIHETNERSWSRARTTSVPLSAQSCNRAVEAVSCRYSNQMVVSPLPRHFGLSARGGRSRSSFLSALRGVIADRGEALVLHLYASHNDEWRAAMPR